MHPITYSWVRNPKEKYYIFIFKTSHNDSIDALMLIKISITNMTSKQSRFYIHCPGKKSLIISRAEPKSPVVISFSVNFSNFRQKIVWQLAVIHTKADKKQIVWNLWWDREKWRHIYSALSSSQNTGSQSFVVWWTEKTSTNVSSWVLDDWFPFSFGAYYCQYMCKSCLTIFCPSVTK